MKGFYVFPAKQGYSNNNNVMMEWIVDRLTSNEIIEPIDIDSVTWIDSGYAFSSKFISQLAPQYHISSDRILRLIHVVRPATPFHVNQALQCVRWGKRSFSIHCVPSSHHPLPSLCEGGGRPASRMDGKIKTTQMVPLVVLSDFTDIFFRSAQADSDIELAFKRTVLRLNQLSEQAMIVGVMSHESLAPRRRRFNDYLARWAKIWHPELRTVDYLQVANG